MACEFRYQHIRNTNPGEAPSSSYIREGEIAVNIAADNERIFLKNTDNEIVSFIPEEEVNKRIDNHTFKSSAITDFVESVENVVNSSTTITNRIKNVVTSAITNDSSVSGAVKSIVSAYTYDKNTIDTKIATHTHASSAVTSMANYSKASAAAAITTGDSLNVAIGKLEKKVDDATAAGGVSSASLGSGSTNGTVTLTVNGTLQDTIYVPGLKGAAFLETGTTTTTVARGKHNHVANDITDFSGSVESVVTSSTTVTNRIKNVIASAITSNTNVTSAITNVISSNTTVISAITNTVSAYTYDKDEIDNKISSHTHASSAVTSMAGYSKASAAAAITTGDSLNVAIGKLEKGIEAAAAGGVSSASLGSGSTNGVVTLTVNGTLQDTIYVPGLKGAAFLETGTTTTTVARGKHNHVANDITDFSGSVESVVNSSTTITNRIKNVITSAITSNTNVTSAITNVISSNTAVTSAVTNVVSAFTYDKNYIDNQISSHTHASSAVTSMRGYSKASAAAAITTGDSLNVAIGKLEKKVDDAVAGGVSSASLGSGTTNGTVTLTVNGTLQDTIYVPGLKGAAFLETGTTTTTVARGKHSHTASDITDFNEAVSGAVKNNTDVKNEIISAVTSSTEFTTVSGDVVTISGDVSTLKSFRDFMSGHNTTTSVASVPITKRLVIATISANASFSLNNTNLADGYELHVIVKNSGSNEITVTFPNSGKYVAVVNSIKIAGRKVGEINVISDGSKLYVRGA